MAADQSAQLQLASSTSAIVDEQAKAALKRPASSMRLNISDSMTTTAGATESEASNFKRTKSMNFVEPTNGEKTNSDQRW